MSPRGIWRVLGLCPSDIFWNKSLMVDRKVIVKMNLVDKVWRHIPTKLQIDPTGNHGVRPLGHNPSTRLMPLGHKVRVYGNCAQTFWNTRFRHFLNFVSDLHRKSFFWGKVKSSHPKVKSSHEFDFFGKNKKGKIMTLKFFKGLLENTFDPFFKLLKTI